MPKGEYRVTIKSKGNDSFGTKVLIRKVGEVMKSYIWFIVGGYLSGSVLFAYSIPKFMKHIDVCELSKDGNPGTYNAFKYGGFCCGVCVLLAELLKGFLPVWLCARTVGADRLPFAFVMASPVFGHAYSVFHHGPGGKAIAVSFGVMLGILPEMRPLLLLIGCYLLFSLLVQVKDHRLRSVVTYVCFAAASILFIETPQIVLGDLLAAGVVIYRHTLGRPGEAALCAKNRRWLHRMR